MTVVSVLVVKKLFLTIVAQEILDGIVLGIFILEIIKKMVVNDINLKLILFKIYNKQ